MCQDIVYNQTSMPNLLGHLNQDEAGMEVNRFYPLVKIECNPHLKLFLCTMYAPMCNIFEDIILPCRSLCNSARSDCEPVMNVFGFPWPYKLNCSQLPVEGGCIDENGTIEVEAMQTTSTDNSINITALADHHTAMALDQFIDIPHTEPTQHPQTQSMSTPDTGRCEAITVPLCRDIVYNQTSMPNFLGHQRQDDAGMEVHQFYPLVKVRCSEYLQFFLCTMYVPKCTAREEIMPPCRYLCDAARSDCEPLMDRFGFQWPDSLECSNLPAEGCIDEYSTVVRDQINGTVDTQPTKPPQRQSTSDSPHHDVCEDITIPLCRDIRYNQTSMPNFLGHHSQDDAGMEVHQFYPLVEVRCSEYLQFFLCAMYVPECTAQEGIMPPCRYLCDAARSDCEPLMDRFGFQWPESLECSNLPTEGCIDEYGTVVLDQINGTVDMESTQPPHTQSMSTTDTSRHGVCEDITITLCRDIAYNQTSMPNFLGHQRQDDAGMEVHQFYPLVKVRCSEYLQFFLCAMYVPKCTAQEGIMPPCRYLCDAARSDCEPLMDRFGFQWPESLECNNLPAEGCIDEYGTVVLDQTNGTVDAEPTQPPQTQPMSTPDTSRHSVCEDIRIPLCRDIVYNQTYMPNFLGHHSQDDAGLEVHQFYPLVKVGCSEYLQFFLCAMYIPKCTAWEEILPPCRYLCDAARSDCEPLMDRFSFELPESLECSNLPAERCIDEYGTVVLN